MTDPLQSAAHAAVPDALCLVGWGCVTPLGANAIESALGFRAGASPLGQPSVVDESGELPFMWTCPTLDPYSEGVARLWPLINSSTLEALSDAQGRHLGRRAIVYLLADEDVFDEGTRHAPLEELGIHARNLVRELIQFNAGIELELTGAAGLGVVLKQARRALSSGDVDLAIICAAHTDHERTWVQHMSQSGRIHGPDRLDGMILGEMAGTLVLTSRAGARRLGFDSGLDLLVEEVATEKAIWSNDESAYEASALTVIARKATEHWNAQRHRVGWVTSDASPEIFRMAELQTVLTRLQTRLGAPQLLDMPAHRMGSMGAAGGVWQLIYAAEAYGRGFARASEILCLLGSERGGRAAIFATTPG